MMHAEELRRAIEAAPRIALPTVTALLWRAYGDGRVTEAQAEELSALIEVRSLAAQDHRMAGRAGDALPLAATGPARRHGSRPRTDASKARRRRWSACGFMPTRLADRFTPGELAVLMLVAAEVVRRGDCRLAVGHLAAVAGVCETTARNALREARRFGLVTIEERRLTGWRNDTNIVRIISVEWTHWLKHKRRAVRLFVEGGGFKLAQPTPVEVLTLGESRPAEPSKGCRGAAGDRRLADHWRIVEGRGAV